MSDNLKALLDCLSEINAGASLTNPEILKRFDALMAPINELRKQFERERAHQRFASQAPCPLCSGTVTYEYRAPLVGSMKCDTPGCIKIHL
jgi:hypothetical protein